MEFNTGEVTILEKIDNDTADSVLELSDLQLAIVGGGVGEVVVG